MIKKVTKQLISGSNSLLFSFRYNDEDERAVVAKHLTYLLSKEFDEETLQFYNNDESVNTMIGYNMFKESYAYGSLSMLFHDIESERTQQT